MMSVNGNCFLKLLLYDSQLCALILIHVFPLCDYYFNSYKLGTMSQVHVQVISKCYICVMLTFVVIL